MVFPFVIFFATKKYRTISKIKQKTKTSIATQKKKNRNNQKTQKSKK